MTISRRFIFFLVGALVFGLAVFFFTSLSPMTSVPSDAEGDMRVMLEVNNFKANRLGDVVCAEGTVKNTSGERLGYVGAIITFFDEGGVFDFSEGYIQSKRPIFMPGEEARFSRCIEDGDGAVDASRTKVNFFGRVNDGIEKRELRFSDGTQ